MIGLPKINPKFYCENDFILGWGALMKLNFHTQIDKLMNKIIIKWIGKVKFPKKFHSKSA